VNSREPLNKNGMSDRTPHTLLALTLVYCTFKTKRAADIALHTAIHYFPLNFAKHLSQQETFQIQNRNGIGSLFWTFVVCSTSRFLEGI
jgi:hypothetical protein